MQLIKYLNHLFFKDNSKKYTRTTDYIFWLMVIIFAFIYSFMSLNNHRLFETYGWDLAVFDHGIWQWSKFKLPYSSFHDLYWLADHFHLILVIITPFYWIFNDVRVLLVVQAVVTCLGAVPIYLLSKRIVKHDLFSLTLSLGYLTFYSLQWHTFSGFHELAFLPLTLGCVMYFWTVNNKKQYFIWFILALFVKEEIGFLLAAFGLWSLFSDRKRLRQSLVSIFLGLIVSLILIYVVMPGFGTGEYRHFGYGKLGNTPVEVIINLIKNPQLLIYSFIDSPQKISTMFVTFWPWLFLPVFAPATLILVFEQFATRFWDYGKVIRWTPFFAYSLPMATIMAWGSIYGFKNLINKFKFRHIGKRYLACTIVSFILLGVIIFEDIILHAPINSLFKQSFYRTEQWMIDNKNAIDCVPDNVSVSAQNNLAPYLSQRHKIKVFPEGLNKGYEYIVVDLHKGQSENSFHFLGSGNTQFIIDDLVSRGLYQKLCEYGDSLVLQKVKETEGLINYPFDIEIDEK